MTEARTIGVSIDCQPQKVYEYVFNPENLTEWARGFALSVRQAGREWKIGTPQGPVSLRFAPRNIFGVLDHYIKPLHGPELLVPMRVVPHGDGSEVVITLFRGQGVSEKSFHSDEAAVRRDLGNLRKILESLPAPASCKPGK
ncbi:MAG: hypothetical protein A2X32_03415 [Elusimicrobia bacterium GWC2_64_44]|nr:MAG: hypothetical protein A2X32_03415 [Elusimicrobia bacterium GWC2_64_44]